MFDRSAGVWPGVFAVAQSRAAQAWGRAARVLAVGRRVACLGLVGIATSAAVLAAENPEGFNTPQGHHLEKSENLSYGAFTQRSASYNCAPDWKRCNASHVGFDQNGQPQIEGKLESATYRREDRGQIESLLLQRNYERVIRAMGGRLHAVSVNNNLGRGDMQQAFLLERDGQVRWIHLKTIRYDPFIAHLTVVTLSDVPDILNAGELRSQLDRQGFITLSVNFDHNKADIRDPDRPALEQVVQMLKADPTLRISVDGHTDNIGGAEPNKLLSQRRAEAIVGYLVVAGIDRSRLQARGFGLESPVADNRSEDGRSRNRRVELVKSP